jgi:large subunit ribosomal protein L6
MASRVAKNPVSIPSDVQITLKGQDVVVKGKLGELKYTAHESVQVVTEDKALRVVLKNDDKTSNMHAGTTRALLENMVKGVSSGFQRKLVLVGVGYRARVEGNVLHLAVGYSHPVQIPMPGGITAEAPSNTEIFIKGSNKAEVCQMAAEIRAVRPPEPYKGKGIRYDDEKIILKEVKKK